MSHAGDAHAMNDDPPQKLTIEVGKSTSISALLARPQRARACFVLAHGAGAGMTHPFMEAVATGLAERDIATLRYQFPYMEKGSKRPDPPAVAHAAVRAAVAEAARAGSGLPLIAGGKSFGGRMTSRASLGSPSSAFPCTRAESPPAIVPIISPMCRSRCCSCRAPTTNWPN